MRKVGSDTMRKPTWTDHLYEHLLGRPKFMVSYTIELIIIYLYMCNQCGKLGLDFCVGYNIMLI